jgi:hypothetical protein
MNLIKIYNDKFYDHRDLVIGYPVEIAGYTERISEYPHHKVGDIVNVCEVIDHTFELCKNTCPFDNRCIRIASIDMFSTAACLYQLKTLRGRRIR